jgi:hypothetical protein
MKRKCHPTLQLLFQLLLIIDPLPITHQMLVSCFRVPYFSLNLLPLVEIYGDPYHHHRTCPYDVSRAISLIITLVQCCSQCCNLERKIGINVNSPYGQYNTIFGCYVFILTRSFEYFLSYCICSGLNVPVSRWACIIVVLPQACGEYSDLQFEGSSK